MTINNTSDAKSLYEAIAEDYDRHMEKTGHYAAQKRILDMLENKIQEPVLDLACGPGFILSNLAKKFPAVIANDFSKPMVELAIKKVGNKVIFYNFNAENITLDTKFKTVLCSNLFYYIKNRPKALKAWAELLSDKGKLILIEECPFVPAESEEMNPHRKKLMSVIDPLSLEQTIKILTDSGFTLEKQVSTPIDKKHNLYGLIFEIKN